MKQLTYILSGTLCMGMLFACGDGGKQINYTLAPNYAARTDVDLENDSRYVVLDQKDGFETLFHPTLPGINSLKPSDFENNTVLGIIRDFHNTNGAINITSIKLDNDKLLVNYNDTLLNGSNYNSSRASMIVLIPRKIKFSEADFYENGEMKAAVTKTGIASDLQPAKDSD